MLWFEGKIGHDTLTVFDVADRGLMLGDGVFDTLLAINGAPVLLDRHVDRLLRACDAIGLPHPHPPVAAAITELAAAHGGRCVIRTTITRGTGQRGLLPPDAPRPLLIATSSDWQETASFVAKSSIVSTIRRNDGSPTSRIKSLCCLDNILALREASERGADDAILLSSAGVVSCATAGNVFLHRNGRLMTPPLSCGVLDGIVRSWILETAPQLGITTHEATIQPSELFEADDVFTTNSVRLASPIVSLDGRPLRSSGRLRPLFEALASLVRIAALTGRPG